MTTIHIPTGPSKAKVADVIEAAIVSIYGATGFTRSGDSAVHAHGPDAMPALTGTFLRIVPLGRRVKRLATKDRVQAHFEISESLDGVTVRASGPNQEVQHGVLRWRLDSLHKQHLLTDEAFAREVLALES